MLNLSKMGKSLLVVWRFLLEISLKAGYIFIFYLAPK